MASTDLYIIAAGIGSRINLDIPKALVPIVDEPCLTTTLQRIGQQFGRVFIVTNILAAHHWRSYFQLLQVTHRDIARRVVNLPIQSGLGDGHATLQALKIAEERGEISDEVIVTWGDAFFPHGEIVDELLSARKPGSGLLPAVLERNPYVSLLVNERMQCLSADFSKHGEVNASGFHDQSIFRFVRSSLRASLSSLHQSFWKNGRYITPGGELTFLYVMHQLYNTGDPAYVYETHYPTLSFNTAAEVSAIKERLGLGARGSRDLEVALGSGDVTAR
jgi:molybdopterin-guanine dinucleotide biosynthesis protein A